MDIHKPKAAHSIREFLIEIGTIISGILLALGLEQGIEWVHRQNVVREARSALNEEAGFDIAMFRAMAGQDDCIQRRLDELERWRSARVAGRTVHLSGELGQPMSINLRTSVWRVTTGAAAAQMSYEDRVKYARLYDAFDNNNGIRHERGQIWSEISPYLHAKHLNDDQLLRLDLILEQARGLSSNLHRNWESVSKSAKDAGVTSVNATRAQSLAHESDASLCHPVLQGG
jgi:hypothetical protein